MGQAYNEKVAITYRNPVEIPKYIQKDIILHKLEFWMERVPSSKEYFDKGLEIFEFQSKECPTLIRYTGNNPNVI